MSKQATTRITTKAKTRLKGAQGVEKLRMEIGEMLQGYDARDALVAMAQVFATVALLYTSQDFDETLSNVQEIMRLSFDVAQAKADPALLLSA